MSVHNLNPHTFILPSRYKQGRLYWRWMVTLDINPSEQNLSEMDTLYMDAGLTRTCRSNLVSGC